MQKEELFCFSFFQLISERIDLFWGNVYESIHLVAIVTESENLSHFDSLQPYGLQPAWLLCPWSSLGKNAGMGCHSLLQGIFPTQGSNPGCNAADLGPWGCKESDMTERLSIAQHIISILFLCLSIYSAYISIHFSFYIAFYFGKFYTQ